MVSRKTRDEIVSRSWWLAELNATEGWSKT